MKRQVTKFEQSDSKVTGIKNPFNQLTLLVLIVTLAYSPLNFDGYVLPKLLIGAIGVTTISSQLLLRQSAFLIPRFFLAYLAGSSIVVFFLLGSAYFADMPFLRAALGGFGRGNGVAYGILTLGVFLLSALISANYSLVNFEKYIRLFAILLVVYAYIQFAGLDFVDLETKGLSPVVLTLGNSNFSGGILSILFTFLIVSEAYKDVHKSINVMTIAFVFSAVLLTEASQGLVVSALAMTASLVVLLLKKRAFKDILSHSILILGIVSIALLFGNALIGPLKSFFGQNSFKLRLEYWDTGLKIIQSSPLFGAGPDNIYNFSSKFLGPDTLNFVSRTRVDNVHNWYLQFGASYGVISLIILMLMFILVLFVAIKRSRINFPDRPLYFSALFTFISILIIASVSIEQPGLGIWLYFFGGILVGLSGSKPNINLNVAKFFISFFGATSLVMSVIFGFVAINDALLRQSVQAVLLGEKSESNYNSLQNISLKLKFQPEYQIKVLDLFAKDGRPQSLDLISREYYRNYPESLQNQFVRVAVLEAVQRKNEACPIRSQIVQVSPYELNQWYEILICGLSKDQIRVDKINPGDMNKFLNRELVTTESGTFENLQVAQTTAYIDWLTGETSNFKRSLEISKDLTTKFFSKYGKDSSQAVLISTIRIAQDRLERLP